MDIVSSFLKRNIGNDGGSKELSDGSKEINKNNKNTDEINLENIEVLETHEVDKYVKGILGLSNDFPDDIINDDNGDGKKFKELEFFQTNDGNLERSFFNKINRCITRLGYFNYQNLIIHPISNIYDLKKRQDIVKYWLLQDKKNYDNIIFELQKLKGIETDIIGLYKTPGDEFKQLLELIYFSNKYINSINYSSKGMLFYYSCIIYFIPLYGMISPLLMILTPYVVLRYILGVKLNMEQYKTLLKNTFFKSSGVTKSIEMLISKLDIDSMNVSLTFKFFMKFVKIVLSLINSSIGKHSYIIFIAITYFYAIYSNVCNSRSLLKVLQYFHKKLRNVRNVITFAKETYEKHGMFNLDNINILNQDNNNSRTIDTLNYKLKSSLQNSFISDLLNSKTIKEEFKFTSDTGIIVTLFKRLQDDRKNGNILLSPILQYIANLDTWIGVTSLYKEYQNKELKISFSEYENIVEGGIRKPHVEGIDIWNICCTEPISNTFKLGRKYLVEEEEETIEEEKKDSDKEKEDSNEEKEDSEKEKEDSKEEKEDSEEEKEDSEKEEEEEEEKVENIDIKSKNNIIITGPNGSGKSTFIKSVMENIILSQTIGLSLANKFSITPFDKLTTYLNIPDCQGRESLFQAEMNRCYQYLQSVENLENDGMLSFNIIDEIFVSTNYLEGVSSACAVVNKIAKYNNCLNIIITHFDLLPKLENKNVDTKYFTIDLDENDNTICDYKIRNGINDKHLALKLLRIKGFDNDLVSEAENIYNNLIKKEVSREIKVD
jgi:hypothetical protein